MAQASAMAEPPMTASRMPPYQRFQGRPGRHQGASAATGSRCSTTTGPFASTPKPIASASQAKPRFMDSFAAMSRPRRPSRTKKVSITSNIADVENSIHSRQEERIQAALRSASPSPGHSLRPTDTVSSRLPSENSGETSRGHHSLTPVTAQPRLINQNSRGGLWL